MNKETQKKEKLEEIIPHQPVTQSLIEKQIFKYVKSIWPIYDQNKNEYLDFDQSRIFINQVIGPMMGRDIISARDSLNSNATLDSIDLKNELFTENEYKEIFSQMDIHKNGKVQKCDVCQYLLNIIINKDKFQAHNKYLLKFNQTKAYINKMLSNLQKKLNVFQYLDPKPETQNQIFQNQSEMIDQTQRDIITYLFGGIEDKQIINEIIKPLVPRQKISIIKKALQKKGFALYEKDRANEYKKFALDKLEPQLEEIGEENSDEEVNTIQKDVNQQNQRPSSQNNARVSSQQFHDQNKDLVQRNRSAEEKQRRTLEQLKEQQIIDELKLREAETINQKLTQQLKAMEEQIETYVRRGFQNEQTDLHTQIRNNNFQASQGQQENASQLSPTQNIQFKDLIIHQENPINLFIENFQNRINETCQKTLKLLSTEPQNISQNQIHIDFMIKKVIEDAMVGLSEKERDQILNQYLGEQIEKRQKYADQKMQQQYIEYLKNRDEEILQKKEQEIQLLKKSIIIDQESIDNKTQMTQVKLEPKMISPIKSRKIQNEVLKQSGTSVIKSDLNSKNKQNIEIQNQGLIKVEDNKSQLKEQQNKSLQDFLKKNQNEDNQSFKNESVKDSQEEKKTEHASIRRSNVNKLKLADILMQTGQQVMNLKTKSMSIQNVPQMNDISLQFHQSVRNFSIQNAVQMQDFEIQNGVSMHDISMNAIIDKQDVEVQNTVFTDEKEIQTVDIQSFWAQIIYSKLNQYPIYEALDLSLIDHSSNILEQLNSKQKEEVKIKENYKQLLKQISDVCIYRKAQILEVKEHLLHKSSLPNQSEINNYSVQKISTQENTRNLKIVKFIGCKNAIVQENDQLKLIRIQVDNSNDFYRVNDEILIQSQLACGNDQILADFSQGNVVFYKMSEADIKIEKIQDLQCQQNNLSILTFLGGLINVFIISESQNSKDFEIYDGEKLDSENKIMKIASNIKIQMRNRVIKQIKEIKGGKGNRNICVIEHDDGEQTLYEYLFEDKKLRTNLQFKPISSLDQNFIVASSLINQNKIIICDRNAHKGSYNYYIFNFDMKIYWQVPKDWESLFEQTQEKNIFCIPNSSTEGLIFIASQKLLLIHDNFKSRIQLSNENQMVKSSKIFHISQSIDKGDILSFRNEALILSDVEEQIENNQTQNYLVLQKVSWEPNKIKKK